MTAVDDIAATEAELERLYAARADAEQQFAAAAQSSRLASIDLADADRLEAAAALGDTIDPDRIAELRADGGERRDRADEQQRRQQAILDQLADRIPSAENHLARLRSAEARERVEQLQSLAVEAGEKLGERLRAAVVADRELRRRRDRVATAAREERALAAAAGVDPATLVDETDWRPERWQELVETVKLGPRRPAAAAETARSARVKLSDEQQVEQVAGVLARTPGWKRHGESAHEAGYLDEHNANALASLPAALHERTLDRAAEIRVQLLADVEAIHDRLRAASEAETPLAPGQIPQVIA